MKIISSIFFSLLLSYPHPAKAQLLAGVAYGTYNVPGTSSGKFRGMGPTLKVALRREESVLFAEASLYNNNNRPAQTASLIDENGMPINAETSDSYSIKHLQFGFSKLIGGEDNSVRFMLGGGITTSFVSTTTKYSIANINKEKLSRSIFGFHSNIGLQWNIKPVILELKGNFDLVLKPIEPDNSDNTSHILTSTRLGILIPLTKRDD